MRQDRTNRAARAWLAVLLGALSAHAAADDGWRVEQAGSGVQRITTPGIDREWIEVEDMRRRAGEPMRFAVPMLRTVSPDTDGTWDAPADGMARWRVQIASPQAVSINLGFGRYRLPDGASLRLLDADGKQPFRSFTAADNEDHGELWTPPVSGDAITVELLVPASRVEDVVLRLDSINHGYRGFGDTPWFAKSGSCNIDVVCPQGDAWRNQIRASAGLASGGSLYCSGALINNVRSDGVPYVLTANHCASGNPASVVFVWNFVNSTCRSGAPSGGTGDGVKTQFNTGAFLRARRADTDFMLFELDDPIDPAFDLYFAGFDARDQVTSSSVGIHHPDGDEMRISFDNQPSTLTGWGSGPVGTHLQVIWDAGTTESGSSGSPLYSAEKRIVGQLHGGGASCGTPGSPDKYGRLALSWAAGASADARLRDWLDPLNTGTLVTDGRNVNSEFDVVLAQDAAQVCLTDADFTLGVSILATTPQFDGDVTLSLTNAPPGLGGSFQPPALAAGDAGQVVLDGFAALGAGTYTFNVAGSHVSGVDTQPFTLEVAAGLPASPTLQSPADGATDMALPVTLAWDAVVGAVAYRVEVATDAAFATVVFDDTVDETSVVVADGLATDAGYHWRVSAISACGAGTPSATRTFGTGALFCESPAQPIPWQAGTALERTLVLPASLGAVESVRIPFAATHEWIGDLGATLEHAGITRVLFDRPGLASGNDGCGGDDPDIVFDDAAGPSAQDDCSSDDLGYAVGGAYRPLESLDAFAGTQAGGAWTLRVTDAYEIDAGTLDRWCVDVTTLAEPLPPAIFDDGFE